MPENQITLQSEVNTNEAKIFFEKCFRPVIFKRLRIHLLILFTIILLVSYATLLATPKFDKMHLITFVQQHVVLFLGIVALGIIPPIKLFWIWKSFSKDPNSPYLQKITYSFYDNCFCIRGQNIELNLNYADIDKIMMLNAFVVILVKNNFSKLQKQIPLPLEPFPIYSNAFTNVDVNSFVKEISERCSL